MPDAKRNPLIGAFRAPPEPAPPESKALEAPLKPESAAVGKAVLDKQTPEASKAPAAPPKAEPATADKAALDKHPGKSAGENMIFYGDTRPSL